VGYYSRKFNEHEKRYHTTEQECLAVVDSLDHFHVYLYGSPFTVVTDHSALQWLSKTKEKNNRLYRWSLRISNYDVKIVHKPGRLNLVPDALSRAPVDPPKVFHASNTFIQSLQEHLSAQEKTTYTLKEHIYLNGQKKSSFQNRTFSSYWNYTMIRSTIQASRKCYLLYYPFIIVRIFVKK
jgi:hypothetical protein